MLKKPPFKAVFFAYSHTLSKNRTLSSRACVASVVIKLSIAKHLFVYVIWLCMRFIGLWNKNFVFGEWIAMAVNRLAMTNSCHHERTVVSVVIRQAFGLPTALPSWIATPCFRKARNDTSLFCCFWVYFYLYWLPNIAANVITQNCVIANDCSECGDSASQVRKHLFS